MGRKHPAHAVCRRRRLFIVPCAEAERKSLAPIGRDQKSASARPRPLQHARAPNAGIGYVVPLDRAPQDPVELVVIRPILARKVEPIRPARVLVERQVLSVIDCVGLIRQTVSASCLPIVNSMGRSAAS